MSRLLLIFLLLLSASASASEILKQGATSVCFDVFVSDSSSSTGEGLTGLVHNSGSLSCYYHKSDAASAVAITLVDMTVGTFTSSGFKAIDGTNMPGWYQLCPPNLAFSSGRATSIQCKGATDMAPMNLRIVLTEPGAIDANCVSGGGGGSRPGMQ